MVAAARRHTCQCTCSEAHAATTKRIKSSMLSSGAVAGRGRVVVGCGSGPRAGLCTGHGAVHVYTAAVGSGAGRGRSVTVGGYGAEKK